jgi:hypothetical protein
MKPKRIVCSVLLVWLAIGGLVAGQSDATKRAKKVCPFSIAGLWKSDLTSPGTPIFFDFTPQGWVMLLGHTQNVLPQDFEMINSVNYRLDTPSLPKRIEFNSPRGNEVFLPGRTVLDIIEYSDDSFTTVHPEYAVQTRWVREQTQRHFLTLAARGGTPGREVAFALWTTLDGRSTVTDALGVQTTKGPDGNRLPIFGPTPPELHEAITGAADPAPDKRRSPEPEKRTGPDTEKRAGVDNANRNQSDIAILCIEITPSEYDRTHRVYEEWSRLATHGPLPSADPYVNGMTLLKKVVESLTSCGSKLKLEQANRERADSANQSIQQQTVGFVRALRKSNNLLHVPNALIPWGWQPVIQLPGR